MLIKEVKFNDKTICANCISQRQSKLFPYISELIKQAAPADKMKDQQIVLQESLQQNAAHLTRAKDRNLYAGHSRRCCWQLIVQSVVAHGFSRIAWHRGAILPSML